MADVLKLLIAERDRLDRAIAVLQGTAPRRGRPPGRRSAKKVVAKRARKKRTMSPEARRRMSERLKAYWAAKREAGKKR